MVTLFKFSCGYCQECIPTITPFVRHGQQQFMNDGTPVYRVKCATGYTFDLSVINGEQVSVIACGNCGEIVAEDSTTTDDHSGHTLCEWCASDMVEVYARGRILTHIDNCVNVYDGRTVLQAYAAECDNCGSTYCTDYRYHPVATSIEGYGCGYDGYCNACHEGMEYAGTDRAGILPYSTDVTDYCAPDTMGAGAHIVSGKPLFIGVELESFIDDDSVANCTVQNAQEYRCIPTEDSSLDDNNGVEFIFTHQTPENIVNSIKGLLNHSDIDFFGRAYRSLRPSYSY